MNPLELPLKVLSRLPDPFEVPRVLRDLKNDVKSGLKSFVPPLPASKPATTPAGQTNVTLVDDSQVSGLQIGEVTPATALIWVRVPFAADLTLIWSAKGCEPTLVHMPHALQATDYTSRVELRQLPADTLIEITLTARPLEATQTASWVRNSTFRTAPDQPRDIRFAWSADVNGQGFGINPDWGGLWIFDVLRQRELDFFVHLGDTVYADHPLQPTVDDERGHVWKNIVTPAKTKVAESLDEYRGNYRYNWLDRAYTEFCANVPQVVVWDDHEVVNNWSPSLDLKRDKRYQNKDLGLLAATAARAFREYMPIPLDGFDQAGRLYRKVSYGPLLDVFVIDMQTYRGPNSFNLQTAAGDDTAFLGREQIAWLKQALSGSTAQWKIIAAGMPVGINVADGHDAEGRVKWQGMANGDDGAPKGRELELADLLSYIKRENIHNIVWLCADVHYTAAHYYDPEKAAYKDFLPFWEFISGPLHAGSYGPFNPDGTFGNQVRFSRASPVRGASPAAGYQFFGEVEINGESRVLTVKLCDITGATLHTEVIAPH